MTSAPATPWDRDPFVWAVVVVGALANGLAFFGGRYLPFNDWGGHVGLSAVLAHGAETGADVYLTRDFTPTPYLLFYLVTAGWSLIMPAEIGAKLNLLVATIGLVIGAARLLEASGRSPRLAAIAPLAMWGLSLGMGFSSFVFATPMILFVLADLEHLINETRAGRAPWRRIAFLSLGLSLAFLGHGLLFIFTALAVVARLLVASVSDLRPALKTIAYTALAVVVPTLLAIPSLRLRAERRFVSPEFVQPGGPELAAFIPMADHWTQLPADLLERGGQGHDLTMKLAALVLLVWLAASWKRRAKVEGWGAEVVALLLLVIFAFGPVRVGWPVTFWIVHQRAGIIAVLLVFLLPRVDLSGRLGAGLAALALVPVLHNAAVNRAWIKEVSSWAEPYDRVRAAIPPGQRILPLSEYDAVVTRHPILANLWPYHFCDGAAYLPIGNIPEEMPVHRSNAPSTPYNPQVSEYDPATVGRSYDYLVLRGPNLVRKTRDAGLHRLVGDFDGWVVFQTLDPRPR